MPAISLSKNQAYMLLNGLPGLGPISLKRLMDTFGQDPLAVLEASREDLARVPYLRSSAITTLLDPHAHFSVAKEEAALAALGGSFISLEHPLYPRLLQHLPDPPLGLYALGNRGLNLPAIAIVGSRRASLYGLSIAKRFAMELARKGFCIISGMARGIDTAAHEGALAADGATIAVLGCGLDKIYPPENKALYHSIAEKGTLLSEFRLQQQADKYTFPMRNRIISGLAHAVVVVETDLHGGSMITARLAGEQGKQVLAVPGRIDQCSSLGCHALIREGATLVRHVDDILDELSHLNLGSGLAQAPRVAAQEAPASPRPAADPPALSEQEGLILKLLHDSGPLSMELVVQRSEFSAQVVQMQLVLLELKRCIARRSDGRFEAY